MKRKQKDPHAELVAWANGLRPDSIRTVECEHDFTFTENKDIGWCTKCHVEYDYDEHGIV